nr:hypothetical protein [Tanacetum cinerariifolium]
ETGDSGGVGMASNLSTSNSEWNGIGICGRTDILVATRYLNGGGVATVSPSSKGFVSSESSEAKIELCRAGAGTVGASNLHKSSEVEDSTLPNHDTDE